ncbi:phage tail assembly protein [Parasedimentitalea maritima]|uniref:Phage tail assembly protein n=1 Tax=Parasedimentitalea maritima TaxID=2578117 RepID=A0A6A4RGH5_9RHOB|nr:phage tail assembly protein [Zongyanglinia marina]KAE9627921.1 phage tail assembly protein [Zongyanglinia marina]
MNDLPDFITEGEDGSLIVTLARGIDVDGAKRTSLTLREPAVSDMMAAEKAAKGHSAMSEVILLANLADVAPTIIQNARMRDYGRLQAALGFMNG